MMKAICFLLLLVLLTGLLSFIFYAVRFRERLQAKDQEIADLQKLLHDLQSKLDWTNQRSAFRLNLPTAPCHFQFLHIGNMPIENLQDKEGEGIIKDISIKGVKISCEYDLPTKYETVLNVQFELLDESFSLKARMVRKEAVFCNKTMLYGLEFINMRRVDEHRLLVLIQNLEMKYRPKSD